MQLRLVAKGGTWPSVAAAEIDFLANLASQGAEAVAVAGAEVGVEVGAGTGLQLAAGLETRAFFGPSLSLCCSPLAVAG